MMMSTLNTVAAAAVLASVLVPLQASAGFAEALRDTKPAFNVRYRMETVDQDGIDNNARASTALARLTWIMPASEGFSAGIEGDSVFLVPPGDEERYNSTNNGPANANRTYGIDYSASFGAFGLSASIAQQSDWVDNPSSYDAAYYSIEARLKRGPVTYTAGYEALGSDDGAAAFRTPTATLHKFQGWTDKFLATPPAGVKDFHLKAVTKVGPAAIGIALHDFKAAEGGTDYGREVDISVSYPLGAKLGLLFKFARYNAREHAANTTKGWFVVTYTL